MSSAKDVLKAWLDAIAAQNLDACAALLADDVLVRVPLAPPGVPPQITGKAAFEPVMRQVHSLFAGYDWFDMELFGTDDPEVAIATSGSKVTLADGRDYVNDYVVFARVRDGLIVEYREYFDPIRAGAALAPA
jgi:uncharacterized protein